MIKHIFSGFANS